MGQITRLIIASFFLIIVSCEDNDTNEDEVSNGAYNYSFPDLSFRSYDAITVTYWSLGYATAGSNYSLIGSHIEVIDVSQDTPDITIDMDATFN